MFLESPNVTFNLRNMLIMRCNIEVDLELIKVTTDWFELTVKKNCVYDETTFVMYGPDLFYCIQKCGRSCVLYHFGSAELDVPANCYKKAILLMNITSPVRITCWY
jgi:hypothetical protein